MLIPDTFYKDLLDNLSDGVYFVNLQRQITYWNGGAEKITGYNKTNVIGKRCMDNILVHVNGEGVSLCKDQCPIVKTMQENIQQEAEVYLHHKDGFRVPVLIRTSPIYGPDGNVVGAVESFSDVSKMVMERRRSDALETKVYTDTLTGIPNRHFTDMKLKNCLAEFSEFKTGFGLIFFDIDNFKKINDSYGHIVGDDVLKMIAHTLNQNLRSSDLIGRWGGEEFVGIILDTDLHHLALISEKLRILVENSHFNYEGNEIGVTISIGGTLARSSDTDDTIIRRADQLMYQCKLKGRNKVLVSE
jgi:diguanylate cyclase (GGDEF)-like protein/PAS domain S-box-containing protein